MFARSFIVSVALILSFAFPVAAVDNMKHQHDAKVNTAQPHSKSHDAKGDTHSEHIGHDDGTAMKKEHVHPVAEPSAGVRLDEKLGIRIPLDLTFADENGKAVRLAELIDRPTLIAPIYYKCPNVCNFMQGGLAEILPEVNLLPGDDYRVLSISFDETEKPPLAARSKQMYLKAADGKVPPEAWRFLTGDLHTIRKLLDSVGYHFQRQGVDFLHPVAAFVVSPEGVVTRYLHGTRFLPKDVTLAFVEAAEGRVGTTIQKMLRYCFSYDPEGKTYVFNLLRVTGAVVLLTAGGFLLFLVLGGRKKK